MVVDNKFNDETFIRTLSFTPDTVLIDPEYWLITKNNTTQKISNTNTGEGIADIYPNPATDPLTVYLHDFNETKADINIYNQTGQLVYKTNAQLNSGSEYLQIPVKNWAKGIYIIKIKAGSRNIVKQILH